jgi:Na+/phosphate symporter
MIKGKPRGKFAKILLRTDSRIFLFFAYIIALISPLLKGFSTKAIVSVIFVHLFFVIIYGLVYFGYEFIQFFFSPILVIIYPISNYLSTQYLKKFKQNIPAHTVIILGQTDWFKLEAWLKNNFFRDELEALVRYLKAQKQDFFLYKRKL